MQPCSYAKVERPGATWHEPMIDLVQALRRLAAVGLAGAALTASGSAVADDIPVGHQRLHIECVGHGTPTVVLDAGLGGSSLEWTYVVSELRTHTRVCTYDRAGYGISDSVPGARTSSHIANELYLLLDGAGEAPPYIVAGHSFGGYNMQIFARRYPYLTAGLVLIDASHPGQVERFLAPPLRMLTAPSSRYGIVKFGEPRPPHTQLPSPVQRAIAARAGSVKARRTLAAELLGFRDSAREVARAGPLVDLPLVVITRGRSDGTSSARQQAIERLWLELQVELAHESSASVHLVARRSGHNVHIEQPQVVAYAIELLVERHRAMHPEQGGGAALAARAARRAPLADVSWLHDSLSLYPMPLMSVAPVAACPLQVACAMRAGGAP